MEVMEAVQLLEWLLAAVLPFMGVFMKIKEWVELTVRGMGASQAVAVIEVLVPNATMEDMEGMETLLLMEGGDVLEVMSWK